jgi:hypothetical protein
MLFVAYILLTINHYGCLYNVRIKYDKCGNISLGFINTRKICDATTITFIRKLNRIFVCIMKLKKMNVSVFIWN